MTARQDRADYARVSPRLPSRVNLPFIANTIGFATTDSTFWRSTIIMASHTIISPTSVDFKQLSAWGIESLNKARYSFDK